MNLIRSFELEYLLEHYSSMKGMVEMLKLQQESIQESESEEILSVALRHGTDGIPPSKGMVSDKTAKTALNLKNNDSLQAVREISRDIALLDITIRKIDTALKYIGSRQRNIIQFRYLQNYSWDEISAQLLLTVGSLQKVKRESLKAMATMCVITIDDFQRIQKLLNIEKGI